MTLTSVQKEIVDLLKEEGNKLVYVGTPVKQSGYFIVDKDNWMIKKVQYKTFRILFDKGIILGQNQNQYFILNPNFKG